MFELPLPARFVVPPAGRPSTTPGSLPGPEAAESATPPARILVVEDEYFVALTIEDALVDAGHEVVGVEASGESAILRALAEMPDLTVMDIRLAGKIDGIDAALQLQRHGLRVLFSSAHSDDQTRKRGEQARPLGWIIKPFTGPDLADAVAQALLGRNDAVSD